MIEFANGFFNLEQPAPNTAVSAGRHVLRGWLVGKPHTVLTDLRVRQGDRIWPAVYGFVRADLAAHFKYPTANLPAAFQTLIFFEPGRASLIFEALAINGHWEPVGTLELEITGPAAAPFVPEAEAPVNPLQFALLLEQLLRRRALEPETRIEVLASRLVSSLASPRYLLHPSPPFHAFFGEPAIIARAAYGRLLVEGYLFHEHLEIKRVLATFDLHVWQTIPHNGVSPIAPRLFPHHANAVSSHVKGYADLPAQLPRPVTLRLYAELADGSLHLCAVQRTFTYGLEDEKKPFPLASPFLFLRTVRALRIQLAAAGVNVAGGSALRTQLWQTWRHFQQRAPRYRKAVTSRASLNPSPAAEPLGVVLVFTQNLDYEGAPLLLLEYCRHLIAQGGAEVRLISGRDGPLRDEFTSAGAAVQLIDVSPLARAASARDWRIALKKISASIDCRDTRLIVANTLASYWAIHLARNADKPSLFYIHESTTPAAFYYGTASDAIVPFVEESFGLATLVSFNTGATSRYYEPFATHANFHLNPGWINLGALDAHRRVHSRDQLRTALKVGADRKLVINLGAVCERKGQNVFAWAVDLLWRQQPELAAQCDFWMVGGRNTPFDESMVHLVEGLARPNLRIIPETTRAYDFLGAADLFVCSSYEESFPRVVLEAMAMEIPILSTNVHGIPEMVRHDQEAWLVPPGDSAALADGLVRMLSQPEFARGYADHARKRVETHFDTALVLPRQVELARQTIAIHAKRD